MDKHKKSCRCDSCRGACEHKPGWFIPSQIAGLLAHFNVDKIHDLLGFGFAIDWWVEDDKDTLILSPNIKGNEGNIRYPHNPQGECVFFEGGECKIHPVKPFECAELSHNDKGAIIDNRHGFVSTKWRNSDLLNDINRNNNEG